jgi:hypothetical protein
MGMRPLVLAVALVLAACSTGSHRSSAAPVSTTRSSVVTVTDFSTGDLRRGLAALGHTVGVAEVEQLRWSSLWGTSPTVLCVDGAQLQVYQYASDTARMAWSHPISRRGLITRGNRRTEVHWIAPPHFFARGKVLAIYVGDDNRLIAALATVLGPTLDPDIPQGTSIPLPAC